MPQLPEPFASIPLRQIRYDRPSPIHPFAVQRDLPAKLHIKRDDQSSPAVCCGNKYRKLEYIIPDVLRTPGVTTVVTEGGFQSNHAAQTAAVAARLGLECVLLLDEQAGGLKAAAHTDTFRRAGNVQMYELLGAQVQVRKGPADKAAVLEQLRAEGKVPYFIPSGASRHPLGGLGYARCALEIAAQEKELDLPGTGRFDYIFVAAGGGSTLGGLLAGFALEKKLGQGTRLPARQLVGVMVMDKPEFEEEVLTIARTAGSKIGLDPAVDVTADDLHIDARFFAPGYGLFSAPTQETVRRALREDGVLLDPVYSGKSATGTLHWLESGELARDAERHGHGDVSQVNILFIHTGGQTALSAYASTSF